ncbi:hypothetical protein WS71_02915 [Burkholderia mayonis]|uniref:Putative tail fiber protein gp53-like C-terminal domain-containing protein n=2 Tax=Burkholderia mayonis TaxID=1385591 RepID=A0A1B4FRY7_9BURK|nr:hypothetical protein WS71_02915 [Burkholderia mayonis]KVE51664.1 hypothetical protein WS71_11530 [Burkholderia mayonis]
MSDPVEGGPNGISNRQARQLGNRTLYLKQQVEQSQSGLSGHVAAADPHPQYATKIDLADRIAALVGQSPETLNTLRELADALGNDPSFATTVTNQLALKAPLKSPKLTDKPTAPTQPKFDASELLATTEFVQRALGSGSGTRTLNANDELTLGDVGGFVALAGTTPNVVKLPPLSSVRDGAALVVANVAVATHSIAPANGDRLAMLGIGPKASIALSAGDMLNVVKIAGDWVAFGGVQLGASAGFEALLASNGHQRLPTGWRIQHGRAVLPASGVSTSTLNVTFPRAFDTACFVVLCSPTGWSNSTEGCVPTFGVHDWAKGNFVAVGDTLGATTFNQTCAFNYIAIGA